MIQRTVPVRADTGAGKPMSHVSPIDFRQAMASSNCMKGSLDALHWLSIRHVEKWFAGRATSLSSMTMNVPQYSVWYAALAVALSFGSVLCAAVVASETALRHASSRFWNTGFLASIEALLTASALVV